MARLVLRVRLCSGDHLDVVYDEPDIDVEADLIDHVIATLAQDGGALRTTHGGRELVLFSRGVAAVEVAPRGAVL
jgi:hypothetical protein